MLACQGGRTFLSVRPCHRDLPLAIPTRPLPILRSISFRSRPRIRWRLNTSTEDFGPSTQSTYLWRFEPALFLSGELFRWSQSWLSRSKGLVLEDPSLLRRLLQASCLPSLHPRLPQLREPLCVAFKPPPCKHLCFAFKPPLCKHLGLVFKPPSCRAFFACIQAAAALLQSMHPFKPPTFSLMLE